MPAVHDLTTNMNYTTIQAAVNAANPGDTILADAGTYAENVTINKSLTLEGSQHGVDASTRSGSESVVTGNGNNGTTPFNVTASDVVIDGFTVEGATNTNNVGAGIFIAPGVHGTQILNNIVQDNIIGLDVSNNSLTDQAVIQQNLFRDNTKPGAASGTDIYADQFSAGTGGVQNVLIKDNTFTNSTFVEDSWGIGVSNTDAAHPFSNVSVIGNTFSNSGRGMYLYATNNATVSGNTFTGATHYAIGAFGGVNGLAISHNTIQNSNTGLLVEDDLGSPGTPDPNSNITVHFNNIVGNTTNILVSNAGTSGSPEGYTGTLDAANNWWGTPSGPPAGSIVDNVSGSSVKVTPWLIAPVGTSTELFWKDSAGDTLMVDTATGRYAFFLADGEVISGTGARVQHGVLKIHDQGSEGQKKQKIDVMGPVDGAVSVNLRGKDKQSFDLTPYNPDTVC